MTQENGIDNVVHRHGEAIVSMDIARIMNDLMPEPMMKLQQSFGGGSAVQITGYEILGHSPDGEDYLYDVKYSGPEWFTVRARWSKIGSEWKIIDADIIDRG